MYCAKPIWKVEIAHFLTSLIFVFLRDLVTRSFFSELVQATVVDWHLHAGYLSDYISYIVAIVANISQPLT